MRQFEGRTAYLSETALEVFESERRRAGEEADRAAMREHWLHLAAGLGVPAPARARISAQAPTERSVESARRLYMDAADRTVREARHEGRWTDVAHLRRAEAAAWFAALGSPIPPPEDVVALHREGMAAVLHSFAGQGTDVELVSAGCCPACRRDDGKAFKIARELHELRLPHAGCPKGLCACDWWIGVVEKKRRRRRPAGSPPPQI